MNKSFRFLLATVLGLAMVSQAMAAAGVRGAKARKVINFSASAVSACTGPGAVYSVLISTGAATDFAVLRDSNTANTTSAIAFSYAANTTNSAQLTFDPPLQFTNGISFNVPATMNAATVTYECGRVTQGY